MVEKLQLKQCQTTDPELGSIISPPRPRVSALCPRCWQQTALPDTQPLAERLTRLFCCQYCNVCSAIWLFNVVAQY